LLLVHPDGLGSKATNASLNISFEPSPNYSEIARAASDGHIFAARIKEADKLVATFQDAIKIVQSGISAVIDVAIT